MLGVRRIRGVAENVTGIVDADRVCKSEPGARLNQGIEIHYPATSCEFVLHLYAALAEK